VRISTGGRSRSPAENGSLDRACAISGAAGYWRFQLARLEEAAAERNVGRGKIATAHLALRDEGAALDWLERAAEAGDSQLAFLRAHPQWDPLRGTPRFEAILGRVGLAKQVISIAYSVEDH
jgi:hypothetical protein